MVREGTNHDEDFIKSIGKKGLVKARTPAMHDHDMKVNSTLKGWHFYSMEI